MLMGKIAKLFFVIALLPSASPRVWAQALVPKLARVAEALECPVQDRGPQGWTRERIKPILESQDVLIEIYRAGGRGVKVSIVYHHEEAEAIKAMEKFFSSDKPSSKIPNLGDEAYVWGYSHNVAFRKGDLNIFVSGGSDIGSLLTEVEESEVRLLVRAEAAAINKNFARMMLKVLSNLDDPCPRPDRYRR
jgi:hypothetical protein